MAEEFNDGQGTHPFPHQNTLRRILIVEDDQNLASLLARWVRDHYEDAVEVRIANSIDEGASAVAELPSIDVVLLDRHFPQGTGEDLLGTLRERFDPLVVMITGVEPTVELIRLPVADYLVKPIERASLIKRLALLEKLETSGALVEYANARKASLLEYHLDDPESDPLFRRFAARWTYDRLEVAASSDVIYVYELYVEDGQREGVDVSIVGTLTESLTDLVDRGDLVPEGELVPTTDGHAWIDIDRTDVVEPPTGGYVVYEFVGDLPERFVDPRDLEGASEIEAQLEFAYQ